MQYIIVDDKTKERINTPRFDNLIDAIVFYMKDETIQKPKQVSVEPLKKIWIYEKLFVTLYCN